MSQAQRSRQRRRCGYRGFINVDIQMRSDGPHISATGDIVGQPMLAHNAAHTPPSLLWCAGTELADQDCGDSTSAGRTFATGQGADRASHCERWHANPARTCAAQAYLWAVLIARIYEVLPLLCPL